MNSALSQSAVQCDVGYCVGRGRRERGRGEHRGHDQHGRSEPQSIYSMADGEILSHIGLMNHLSGKTESIVDNQSLHFCSVF